MSIICKPGAVFIGALGILAVVARGCSQIKSVRGADSNKCIEKKSNSNELTGEILSVVIPAFNEERSILKVLNVVRDRAENPELLEVVVVDAGCIDNTMGIVQKEQKKNSKTKIKCARSPGGGGRGPALNRGAAAAAGAALVFLHADTAPPPGFDGLVREALDRPGCQLAHFRFGVDRTACAGRPPLGLGLLEAAANARARLLGLPYGDQVFCVTRRAFRALGGFPDFPLMEDYEFARRAARAGGGGRAVVEMDAAALCAPRRWEKNGVLKNSILNFCFVAAYNFGCSPQQLFRWYYGKDP